jgi:hypothetical protein
MHLLSCEQQCLGLGHLTKQHTGLKEQPLGAFSLYAGSHWIGY